MSIHSFYFLQPLDVSCFSLMKKVYGIEIKHLIQVHITYITKKDFFPVFKKAFNATITESNIKRNFKRAGLIPMNPQNMFSKLDVKLVILQTSRLFSCDAFLWISKTLQNLTKVSSQSEYIKN